MNALLSKLGTVVSFLTVIRAFLHSVLVPVKIHVEKNISAMVSSVALNASVNLSLKKNYWSIVDVQYYFSFRCTAQWFDIYAPYDVITTISLVSIRHRARFWCYWHIPCAVHYIPVAYLCYNWKLGFLICSIIIGRWSQGHKTVQKQRFLLTWVLFLLGKNSSTSCLFGWHTGICSCGLLLL